MTSSERMACLVHNGVCNSLVQWSIVMVSVLASC